MEVTMVSHIVRRWRRGNEERIDVGTVVLVSSDSVDKYMVVMVVVVVFAAVAIVRD